MSTPSHLLLFSGVWKHRKQPPSPFLAKQRAEETFFDKTWLCLTHSFLCLRVREALAGHTSHPKTFSSAGAIGEEGAALSGQRSEELYKHPFLVPVQSEGHGLLPTAALESGREVAGLFRMCTEAEVSLHLSPCVYVHP